MWVPPAKYAPRVASKRPNPALWLFYQFGGRLPDAYRDWVLHDATCKTWVLRVCVRGLIQIGPFAIALVIGLYLTSGSWPLALGSVLLGVLAVTRITLTSSVDSTDARLARHGYPSGYGSTFRRRQDEAAAERYRAVWRQTGD